MAGDRGRRYVLLWIHPEEGTGKSIKNDCMYSGMAKGTSRAEVTSNREKIKPIALDIVKLCLSERHQSGSQSVENFIKYIYLKFHSSFLKAFQVDLKAYLGLK